MVSLSDFQTTLLTHPDQEYLCRDNLNLYDSPQLERLATQAIAHRHLRVVPPTADGELTLTDGAVFVRLCEDDYPGWMALEDVDLLDIAEEPYCPVTLSTAEIGDRLPQVIAFAQAAMRQPNHYLWGGTTGPNYDCSGLVQTAFASAGIWLPRDAYQQEAFVQAIALADLQPGDLIFFGTPERCTHVGLALGESRYIHSSGKDQGRNGIGIDILSNQGDAISQAYYHQLRGAGRVVACYSL